MTLFKPAISHPQDTALYLYLDQMVNKEGYPLYTRLNYLSKTAQVASAGIMHKIN